MGNKKRDRKKQEAKNETRDKPVYTPPTLPIVLVARAAAAEQKGSVPTPKPTRRVKVFLIEVRVPESDVDSFEDEALDEITSAYSGEVDIIDQGWVEEDIPADADEETETDE